MACLAALEDFVGRSSLAEHLVVLAHLTLAGLSLEETLSVLLGKAALSDLSVWMGHLDPAVVMALAESLLQELWLDWQTVFADSLVVPV